MTAPHSDLGTEDPRRRDDGLGWVATALYPDERVDLHVGAARSQPALPAGRVQLSSYAVVPSATRARFLIPLTSRRVASSSLRAYNALRPLKVRTARAGLSVAARLGALGLPTVPRLTVSIPADADRAEVDLVHHLSIELGISDLAAAVGVRPPDPNAKPTLQLFDATGRAVGFAKVGWNNATRDLVSAEAAALRRVDTTSPDHPIVPRVMLTTHWQERTVVVVEPLPPRTRGLGAGDGTRVTEALVIARRGGPPSPPRTLGTSSFIERTRRAARSPGVVDAIGDRLAAIADRFAALSGDIAVEFGWWHGDWVPWNLGAVDGRLVVWDWEHSGPDMPVGADIAHHGFQRALVLEQLNAAAATERAHVELVRNSGQLDLNERQLDVVLTAYLIEMWLRTHRLAAGGGGWNRALHPHLLHEVERRLTTGPSDAHADAGRPPSAS